MEANLFVCIHKGTLLNWFLQQRNEPAELLLSCDVHHRKAEKKFITIIIKITITNNNNNKCILKLHRKDSG